MAFPRGQTRTATGGAAGGGGSGGGGRRGIGGRSASGAACGLQTDPEGAPRTHAATDRRRSSSPYWVQVVDRARRDPGDEPHRADQPAPAWPADRPGHRRWQLPEPEPVCGPDDRAADHHRASSAWARATSTTSSARTSCRTCGARCTPTSRACRCASSPRRARARSRAGWPTTSVVSRRW